MDSNGSLFSAELISQNILKNPRKRDVVNFDPGIVSPGNYLQFPQSVRIDQAAGGFSTVVEISAQHCLKVLDLALDLPYSLPLDTYIINQLISAPHDPFTTAFLNQPLPVFCSFSAYEFTPVSLTFKDPHELVITYEAYVGYGINLPDPPQMIPIDQIPGIIGDLNGPFSEIGNVVNNTSLGEQAYQMRFARSFMPASQTLIGALHGQPLIFSSKLSTNSDSLSARQAGSDLSVGRDSSTNGMIGRLRLEITCPYSYDADGQICRVDVYANLGRGTLKVLNTDDDIARLYQAGAFGNDGALLHDLFMRQSRTHITPTIAVAGRSSAAITPDEFQNFDAVAFHVTDTSSKLQAMTVAINLKPGCLGIIEDVPHFIGSNDFGIITDEFRIERLFHYKWRTGGFFRLFPLSQATQVQRNNSLEDATLYGHLSIDTLDVISFEIEANTDVDVVKIGGSGSVYTDYVQLSDGTKIYQPDTQHTNFGDPKVLPWTFISSIKINPVLPSEPLLRQFQERAYSDAFQYIARPYANVSNGQAIVTYTRLQAVSKQAFMLGTFAVAFI